MVSEWSISLVQLALSGVSRVDYLVKTPWGFITELDTDCLRSLFNNLTLSQNS